MRRGDREARDGDEPPLPFVPPRLPIRLGGSCGDTGHGGCCRSVPAPARGGMSQVGAGDASVRHASSGKLWGEAMMRENGGVLPVTTRRPARQFRLTRHRTMVPERSIGSRRVVRSCARVGAHGALDVNRYRAEPVPTESRRGQMMVEGNRARMGDDNFSAATHRASAGQPLPETPHELPVVRSRVDTLRDRGRKGERIDILEEFLNCVDWRARSRRTTARRSTPRSWRD